MPKRSPEYMQAQRERILDAALKVFADQGFGGASMRDVATSAKVNIRILYVHFKDKTALFKGVATRQRERYPALDTTSLGAFLDWTVAAWSGPVDVRTRRLLRIYLHLIHESLVNASVRRRVRSMSGDGIADFDELVDRDPRTAALPVERRRRVARQVLCLWTGFIVLRLTSPDVVSESGVREMRDAVDAIVAAETAAA